MLDIREHVRERIVGLSFMTNGYLNWRSVWDVELWEWRHYAAAYDEHVEEMRKARAQEAMQRG